MYKLPEGEYLNSTTSPNSNYTINFYLCNGGATTDYAIRGNFYQVIVKKLKTSIGNIK
jgi:hypothetical protein